MFKCFPHKELRPLARKIDRSVHYSLLTFITENRFPTFSCPHPETLDRRDSFYQLNPKSKMQFNKIHFSGASCHNLLLRASISSSSLNAKAHGFSFSTFSIVLYQIFSHVVFFLGSLKTLVGKIFWKENLAINLYARNLKVFTCLASFTCSACRVTF